MMRTHRAGDLRAGDIGESVVVCGWVASRRDHGGIVFLDVRDVAGLVQVVVDPGRPGSRSRTACATNGCCASRATSRPRPRARSTPTCRPARSRSSRSEIEVLNEAEPPPFPLDDRVDVDEVLRLRHRYLDLRRAPMQRNLRAARRGEPRRCARRWRRRTSSRSRRRCSSRRRRRARATSSCRRGCGPATFYALPQSPQLFKQLLMVGGLDRYFQIARCLRDEDLRADRQFEFMQLDVEMTLRRPGRRARRRVGRGARGGRGGAARRGARRRSRG